jgi:protocatechuate 3,4-dioxygenase beta subunit
MHDDETVGRLLSRREVIALLGTASAGCLAGEFAAAGSTSLAGCVVRPRQTEGPYFVDAQLDRPDIRSDPSSGQVKQGVPLALTFNVSRMTANGCQPLSGAQVDLWHCDALGVYSGVDDAGFNTPGSKFLRGYQVTDASGEARFVTVYPGAYSGRAVHIHFKVRTEPGKSRAQEFVSQLYFDEDITRRVHAADPYLQGPRAMRNEKDGIFRRGGRELVVSPVSAGEGYAASFSIGLELT